MLKVLVTGVTGFIGNALSKKLLEEGSIVYGLVRHTSNRYYVPEGVRVVVGDLTDPMSMERVAKTVTPDIVVHVGALTPVSLSYDMPRTYAYVNYLGTVNLAEACNKYCENLKAFIYASTSEVYGQNDCDKLKEDEPCYPNTPYAVAKYSGELYVRKYMVEAYDFPAFALRPFNTYGRAFVNQNHFVIEKLITMMLEGSPVIYMGDGTAVRDFVFRDDHVNGYIRAIETALTDIDKLQGKVFNISTGHGYTIQEVAKIIADEIGWDGDIYWDAIIRPADIKCLIGDNSLAKKYLDWEPKYDIVSGLQKAIEEWRSVL